MSRASTTADPCTGYRLRSSVQWSHETVTIAIPGLYRPSPCVPLSSTATGTLCLGDLADTTVVFCITYRGYEDRYRITFSRGASPRVTSLRARLTVFRR